MSTTANMQEWMPILNDYICKWTVMKRLHAMMSMITITNHNRPLIGAKLFTPMGKLEHDLSDYLRVTDLDDRMHEHAENIACQLTIPEWMSTDMKERHIEAQTENIFNDKRIEEPEDWHSDAVEYCTCTYCKSEWTDEYAESLEVLGQENKTKWRE